MKLCKDDIKTIYERLVETSNKWAFFRKLQYEFYEKDNRKCFRFYLLKRAPEATLDAPTRVKRAYENWFVIEPDFLEVKKSNIDYFIYSSYNQYQPGKLKDFYDAVIRNSKLVKIFRDSGPEIRIYKIEY
ncbi:MAG: hypothetical protein NZ870_04975 [bacterium]|nr:hypothetical protein [bacterium]